jgi:Ca2+-binding RTX toxin-like protein
VGGAANSNAPKLIVLDIASARQRQLARSVHGTWSPDGRRVAYARADGIHVIGADGSGDRKIRATGQAPVWSPRGDLAFADDGECNEYGIFTMRPDGSGVRRLTQICRLVGTPGADTIAGTNSRDVIRGLGGNDNIDANPGDRIKPYYGIPDADDVDAGPGDDVVFGRRLADNVRGGPGDDRLVGGSGVDSLDGGPGNDTIEARDRTLDRIRCGSGDDRVVADRLDVVARDCEHVTRR